MGRDERLLLIYIVSIACLYFSGCAMPVDEEPEYVADYDDARRATVEAWEYVFGIVSLECSRLAQDAIVTEVGSSADMPDGCAIDGLPDTKYVAGCHLAKANQIYIHSGRTERGKADTAIHEFVHLLSTCMFGDGDGEHANILLWDEFGSGTVEAIGGSNLRF